MAKPRRTGEIAAVEPGSLADESGLHEGDRVLAVNGQAIRDQLDYRFEATEDLVELTVVHDGDEGVVEFTKHPDESLGIEFSDDAFDGTTLCNNKCFFCFLKGLPKGLRKTLYVKDDDYRLSFEHGNFVTLTNLDDEDWERLEAQRLSPLNLSVHATDLELRRRMLGNTTAPDVRIQLKRLASIGIEVNTQVVLCPGMNDGAALDETIDELLAHENVRSVGVVPVGASVDAEARFGGRSDRASGISLDEGAAFMRSFNADEAKAVLRQIRRWQRYASDTAGPVPASPVQTSSIQRAPETPVTASVFASDEFYLRAQARIPSAKAYTGFPQWENGVGMVRTLIDDWYATRRRLRRGTLAPAEGKHVTIACGTLIGPTMARLAGEAAALANARIDVVPVRNSLFGNRVNVAGLLPGQAYIDQLTPVPDAERGEIIFLPRASLDYFGKHFLDDVTPDQVAAAVDRPIAFAYNLSEVIEWMSGGELTPPGRGDEGSGHSNGRSWSVLGDEV